MSTSSGKAFDWKLFGRLFAQRKPYRFRFRIALFAVLVLAFLGFVRPQIVRHIIDVDVPADDLHAVWLGAMLFVAILFVEALFQFFQTFYGNSVAQSVTLDLRSKLYRHVLKFKLRYFDRTPVGQLVTRHISDIDGMADVFSEGFLQIFGDLLKLVVIVIAMFCENWALAFIVLLPIPILMYATRIFQLAVKKSFNDVRNQVARINTFIQEHITGMHIVQIFNREKREAEKFDTINREHRNAHIRGIWAYSVFFPVVELLSAASISLLLWWGLKGSLNGQITPGVMMLFTMYIFQLYRPIRQMADNFNTLQMGVVNAERVFKLLDTGEAQEDTGTVDAQNIKGDIAMRNVWFAYNDEQWVLRDVSLDVNAGQMLAFVGATGAGKSSIINLLNRFYDFQKGEILIDRTNIRSYTLESLRKNVGLVLQDVFLFSDSIHNNVALNNPAITREQVIEASKLVGTHDFIMRLPGGYDYNVRERGATLSTGQRQLISFLRAFVHNSSILILDEATSSVDTESEELIQHATQQLVKGRTSIVIAHRLSTIQQADKIVVMDKGQIIEMGRHEELLTQNGQYKRLFELQFQEL